MAKAEWDPYKRVENDATHTAEVGPRDSVPKVENTIKTMVFQEDLSTSWHMSKYATSCDMIWACQYLLVIFISYAL